MKQTKLIVRIAAGVLAVLLLVTTLVSGLGMRGFAATAPTVSRAGVDDVREDDEDGRVPNRMRNGDTYYIEYHFTLDPNDSGLTEADLSQADNDHIELAYEDDEDNEWSNIRCELIRVDEDPDNGNFYVVGSFTGTYRTTRLYPALTFHFDLEDSAKDFDVKIAIDENDLASYASNDDYYTDGGATDLDDGYPDFTSQIVVENMVALDSAGNRIDEITKDSPPFTLEVVFADMGLQHVDMDELDARDVNVYVSNAGGFILGSGARGTIRFVSQSDYPRYRAQFSNVTYSGGDKTLGFSVFYEDLGADGITPLKGDGTATLFSAQAEGEDEEDDSAAGIKVPKIIISAYTYGDEAIVAGDEFSLDFTVTNTSADLALENIVMTLTPAAPEAAEKGPGLIVASSSNTIYLPALGPGASQSNSVSFKARPDAEVTSHLVNVKFSYEYQKSEKEGYVAAPELSESIAIPVSQIDRFSVDPIQEEPYGEVGQEAYLTVNFINKGKSPTYNISGTVEIDESVSAPPQHFGNLEAGASDSLDFFLTGSMAGVFAGEIVLQYEDDNGNVKELRSPFSMTVEEPWMPPMDPGMMDPGMMEPPPPAGPGVLTIVLCAVGGLAIAVPLALYLMKRVRAKGREEFDETV